jgi:hypothetical protein
MCSQIRMALLIGRDLVFAVTDMRTGLAEVRASQRFISPFIETHSVLDE